MFRPRPLWHRQPIYYMGNHLAFVTDGAAVASPSYTHAFDYELELGFVLSGSLFNARPEEAETAIGGFEVLNDFGARFASGEYPGWVRSRSGGLSRCGDGAPVPGQQLGDALGGVIGDASEDVGEPGARIDVVELARLDQRVDSCRPRSAGIGASRRSSCAGRRQCRARRARRRCWTCRCGRRRGSASWPSIASGCNPSLWPGRSWRRAFGAPGAAIFRDRRRAVSSARGGRRDADPVRGR